MNDYEQVAQAAVDIITWFLMPFAFVLVIEWAIGLFRRDG